MRERVEIIYEQEDFDKIKKEMTPERAIEILSELPRGWFPYRLPEWNDKVTESDLWNFEICCAIHKAVEALKEQ